MIIVHANNLLIVTYTRGKPISDYVVRYERGNAIKNSNQHEQQNGSMVCQK